MLGSMSDNFNIKSLSTSSLFLNFDFKYIQYIYNILGVKGDWDFWISDQLKNPDGTDI